MLYRMYKSMLVILLETTGIKLMVCNGWILEGSYHTAGQYYEKYGWCAMELFDIVPSWCCRSKRRGWPQIRRVYEIREFGGTQWRRVASDRIIEIYWGELLCFELWGFLDSRNDDEWPDNPYYTFFINPPRTFISVNISSCIR